LGHGSRGYLKTPKRVEALKGESVKMVACGEYHMGVICQSNSSDKIDSTEDTRIFVWGKGDWGRLGLGNSNSKALPTPLEVYEESENGGQKLVHFSKIRMGKNYSSLIDSHGKLYMFGRNEHQQLGIESAGSFASGGQFDGESTPTLIPQFIDKDVKVKDVALGESITACITQDGRGFIWGKNVYLPHEVNFGKGNRMVECSAGRNHVAFLPMNRKSIFMMGGNWSYQLGQTGQHGGQEVIKLTRHLVPGKKLQVACGSSFTCALIDLEHKFEEDDEEEFTDFTVIDNILN